MSGRWGHLLMLGEEIRLAQKRFGLPKQRRFGGVGGMESEIGWERYLDGVAEGMRKLEQAALDESMPILETFKPK
jgi:hypothetical protein